jgi:hypothetical protein
LSSVCACALYVPLDATPISSFLVATRAIPAMISFEIIKKSCSQFRSDLKKAQGTAGLTASLPKFFREQVTVARAKEEIRRHLENRGDNFLELVRTYIYERPSSPYRQLLKFAGCDFSDLRAYVRRHGLEEALKKLAMEGVYLTSDEFKGKKDVVRGGLTFRVCPGDFEFSNSLPGFFVQSSGTKNKPVRTATSLAWLRMRTLGVAAFSSAHDLFSYSHALYDAILPASSVNHLLINAKLGIQTHRWFARRIPVNNTAESWYHSSATYLIVLMGKCFGSGFPSVDFLDIQDIHRIVRWISEQKKIGNNCYIITVASSAARIARVAWEMGVSLEGTKFNVAGEPFTAAKEDAIKQVGATTTSRYSYGGGIPVGHGCAHAIYRDEVHVNQHILAVISNPRPVVRDIPIHPLLLTTLHSVAPRLFLNVENGDYVTLEERHCGCSLEDVGLTLHLHQIRSFEKFTSEGMNYFYGNLYELLEKIFPSEFGGGPGDYQLVEEEDNNAQTRLTLVVHPEVGELDEKRLVDRLRAAFSEGSRGNRFMTGVWENAGTFSLKREVPYTSARGKILPLHIPHGQS